MKASSTLIKVGGTGEKKDSKLGVEQAKFPVQERMLLNALYIRRQLMGLWVDRYWLQAEFAVILRLTKPEGYLDFKCIDSFLVVNYIGTTIHKIIVIGCYYADCK